MEASFASLLLMMLMSALGQKRTFHYLPPKADMVLLYTGSLHMGALL